MKLTTIPSAGPGSEALGPPSWHVGHEGTFASNVYSNMSPLPLPYKWDLRDDTLTISVSYGALGATFRGRFSKDGKSFSGGWRPNPGADESINVPYDIGGTRVE